MLTTSVGRALLVGGCLVASLAVLVQPSAVAVDAVLEEGTALPWRYETVLGHFELAGRSTEYLMHSRGQYDEDHDAVSGAVRVVAATGRSSRIDAVAVLR